MKTLLKIVPLVALLAWSAACETQKVPAETAYKAAETAWTAVSADAMKYLPAESKPIQDAMAKAKADLANGKYEDVLKAATPIPGQIAELTKTLAQKKDEWTAAWKTLDSTLGSGIVAVQAKVDELLAAKRLPAGIDKAAVEGAKTALAATEQAFADAKAAYGSGDYQGALAKANQVKADLAKVMTDLKLEMPAAADAAKALTESAKATINETLKK
jgi:hypothetical protein